MPMSEDDRRKLAEIEARMQPTRRLTVLSRQLGSASVYTGLRRITAAWIAGGSICVIMLIAGSVARSSAVVTAAWALLAFLHVTLGIALIGVEVTGLRRDRRWRDGGAQQGRKGWAPDDPA